MRWAVLVAATACSFRHGELTAGAGDAFVGEPPPAGTHWLIDTAADFGATGYSASAIDIEAVGALTPTGYAYGGLLEYGLEGTELWNTSDTNPQWSATTTATPSGAGMWDGRYTTTNDSYANVGVTNNAVFSLWFEGDVYVDAGDALYLDADGAAFVDVLGATGWTTVVTSRSNGAQVSTVTFPQAGWLTMRMGYGEGTNSGHLDLRHGPSGAYVAFTRDRLRAPTSTIAGTMQTTCFRQLFGGASGDGVSPVWQVQPAALFDPASFAVRPPGASTADWSARLAGQMYVTTPGMYALAVASDNGNRARLGTVTAGAHWMFGDTTQTTTPVMAMLRAGWNDVAIDYTHVSASAGLLDVSLSAAADGVTGRIAPDRLRAVEPRADRLIVRTAIPAAPLTVMNDNGTPTTIATAVAADPGEIVTSLEVMVRLTTGHENQLVFTLTPPNGTPIAIQTHGGGNTALTTAYIAIPVTSGALVGIAAAGTWTLGVADNVMGPNTTSVGEFHLTLHTSGGPEQVALTGTWISPVRDATAAATVEDVRWSERAPLASDVYVRSCDQPDCSDQTDWGTPVVQQTAPALAPRRYLETRVTMHSDGTIEPELDSLEITYHL